MGVTIDDSQVRRIAHLARLNLNDEEIRTFAPQLSRVLEYVRQLESIDTEGVEPLAHPLPIVDVTRDDEPRPSFDPETALKNAPQRLRGFFSVPKVLDQSSGA